MGFFDFFRKKASPPPPSSPLALGMLKYKTYLNLFIQMQSQDNYAPIGAYETAKGELVGFVFITPNQLYNLSIREAIEKMEEHFEQKLANRSLLSYTIFYHSQYNPPANTAHDIAEKTEEFKAISVRYYFSEQLDARIGLPYKIDTANKTLVYQGFKELSDIENELLSKADILPKHDYFQDKMEFKPEITQNEAGIKMTKTNTCNLSNTWGGIFGFGTYRNGDGYQMLLEQMALAAMQTPDIQTENFAVHTLDWGVLKLKAVMQEGAPKTFLPIIQTENVCEVETTEIAEWEQVDNLEAIVSGRGKNTFGISYYATDYAENKHLYQSRVVQNIALSGIAYVVDVYTPKSDQPFGQTKDFAAFLPTASLPNQACYDFIATVRSVGIVQLFENQTMALILQVNLLNHPEIPDFFLFDLYVCPENMRLETIQAGMMLTGVFQMQGRIHFSTT